MSILERLTVAQLVSKFSTHYGIRKFITIFINPIAEPYPQPAECNLHHTYFLRFILILSLYACPKERTIEDVLSQ